MAVVCCKTVVRTQNLNLELKELAAVITLYRGNSERYTHETEFWELVCTVLYPVTFVKFAFLLFYVSL